MSDREPDAEGDGPTAAQAVHTALDGYLADGELAVSWVLTIDIAGPDGTRYLAHRAGGGHDGTDGSMVWNALGMLEAAVIGARDQLSDSSSEPNDDQEGEP